MSDCSAATDGPETWPTDIGRRLAAYRTERGLRVAELAREVGVTPSLISQIERGQSRPSVSTLFAIAQALDVPVDAFFREPAAAARPPPMAAGNLAGIRPAERQPADGPLRGAPGPPGGDRHRGRRALGAADPATQAHLDFFELVYGPAPNPTRASTPTLAPRWCW